MLVAPLDTCLKLDYHEIVQQIVNDFSGRLQQAFLQGGLFPARGYINQFGWTFSCTLQGSPAFSLIEENNRAK
jgi:hypothetical protein